MPAELKPSSFRQVLGSILGWVPRGHVPATSITILLACVIGVLGGYGAVFFTFLIHFVQRWTLEPFVHLADHNPWWWIGVACVPALGLLAVSWFTRRYAPEAQGHGVPEVILAVARNDGVIRPRVSMVKILASGVCIGTGGSIGREGPIVQIGSSLGSMFGQWCGLTPRHIKMLVAAGAAAGISATFNAPLAGVIFASEIILGSFAIESITPVVVASVLANVVQEYAGEHGFQPAFPYVYHEFHGAWHQLPSYFLLGILCGLAAVMFTKMLYGIEDLGNKWLKSWTARALIFGGIVGVIGVAYPSLPPQISPWTKKQIIEHGPPIPALFGVGYRAVDHTLHLETEANDEAQTKRDGRDIVPARERARIEAQEKTLILDRQQMLGQLWWLLPLAFLKPLLTSLTLGGGGSGGIFAPSLYIGAALGASFGIVSNLLFPGLSADPGAYAIVGMGAVVAGTTHGPLSAIVIVYEMTGDYRIILPIMVTAGLAGVVAGLIDPESIYFKKLSRRAENVARAHDMHRLEHIMVRNVMLRHFPTVKNTDTAVEIIRVARANAHIESLPVMDENDKLVGIISPADLHRVLDSDVPPQLINADDIAMRAPFSLSTNANILEALRDFGASDIESLPVEQDGKIVGLLLRSDVMRRYREEMLRRH